MVVVEGVERYFMCHVVAESVGRLGVGVEGDRGDAEKEQGWW